MFRLSAQDNGLYFFRGRNGVLRCEACEALKNKWDQDLASVPIVGSPESDVSSSYDGVLVTSSRFKECVESAGLVGLAFRPLQCGLFAFRPEAIIAFDAARRGTRFEGPCALCGEYESVIGATPVSLMPGAAVAPQGFARTQIEFGSGDEKTPLVFVGEEAAKLLLKMNLRGVDLFELA